MQTQYNDHRAAHTVTIVGSASHVKFLHNDYTISLAADGQETIVFDKYGENVFETPTTTALAVSRAVEWIDENT